jgi:hypothetical protein
MSAFVFTVLGGVLLFAVRAVASAVLVGEARAWYRDWLVRKMERAVLRLPRSERDEYRTTWLEELETALGISPWRAYRYVRGLAGAAAGISAHVHARRVSRANQVTAARPSATDDAATSERELRRLKRERERRQRAHEQAHRAARRSARAQRRQQLRESGGGILRGFAAVTIAFTLPWLASPADLEAVATAAIICTGLVFTARFVLHLSMGYLRTRGLRGPTRAEAVVAGVWVAGGGATVIVSPAPLVVMGFVLVLYALAARTTIRVSAAAQQAGMPRVTDVVRESRVARNIEHLPNELFIRVLWRMFDRETRGTRMSAILALLVVSLVPLVPAATLQVTDWLAESRPRVLPAAPRLEKHPPAGSERGTAHSQSPQDRRTK